MERQVMMRNVVVQDRTCSEGLFYKRYKITGYKMLLKLGPLGLEGWESNFVGFNLLGFFFYASLWFTGKAMEYCIGLHFYSSI